jgi:uncharacterized membrane protein YkvI
MKKILSCYLIPGAIFQSSIMAGGYGTGREVMEYVSKHGPWGGLLACLVSVLIFSVVLSLTFELARLFKTHDYQSFIKILLGPGWIFYEGLLLTSMLVVTAVIAAASGQVLSDILPVPAWVGVAMMLVVIVILNYLGRAVVVAAMGITAVLVTVVLLAYCAIAISNQTLPLTELFATSSSFNIDALYGGATFAIYNCLSLPVLLFAATAIESRKQAFSAGIIGAFLAVLPAVFLHLSFLEHIPTLVSNELPTYWMLKMIDIKWFFAIYLLVLFSTVVQSGVGVLHGLNERIDNSLRKSRGVGLSKLAQAMISGGFVLVSAVLAQVGVIELIATGYRFIAIGLLFVYIIPLVTWGCYRIFWQPGDNALAQ